ncbi:YggS family pyridoxal phosphate-dependent enzyme [Lentzea sp. NBC_00516]|uniref:YggS family pyridoxal phosphate-dependent enzyme n=1 Tax=Lentzea sp. NBC_00516 TaxID=2903582 RepID=UPI002E7FCE7B|nr:YggS family pyridoxal phosphate-dependent enzyme [Lentzea sp. NBC_00516]WUD24512.1 YggS family pyridoxal phosphate-dependent enzyme [Lentzea sp. NBC_00516]
MNRAEELKENLAEVEERIAKACEAAGRGRDEVMLLAVTKTWPASDVEILYGLGLRNFAENRDQEAGEKVGQLRHLEEARWHMVGRLQRNKAKSVVEWADQVDSVDSVRLAEALARAAHAKGRTLDVLLQVSIDGDTSRGGVAVADVAELAGVITRSGDLILRGAMTVAPRTMNPSQAFQALVSVVSRLRDHHPTAIGVSAGMSGDLEDAISHGSTCVRVGTALLGSRRLISP